MRLSDVKYIKPYNFRDRYRKHAPNQYPFIDMILKEVFRRYDTVRGSVTAQCPISGVRMVITMQGFLLRVKLESISAFGEDLQRTKAHIFTAPLLN